MKANRAISKRQKRLQAALEAIYAQIPKIDCQRHCWDFCGPIPMTRLEWDRIEEARAEPIPTMPGELMCPMLDGRTGSCTQYAVRPMICRMWGVVDQMPCPYGCRAERLLTSVEAGVLIEKMMRLSGEIEMTCTAGDLRTLRAMQAALIE